MGLLEVIGLRPLTLGLKKFPGEFVLLERKRTESTRIGIALVAMFVLFGTAYGFLPLISNGYESIKFETWTSGVIFILNQVLATPVLLLMAIPAFLGCCHLPRVVSMRHVLLLFPLIPTMMLIGFDGYCFVQKVTALPRQLELWQVLIVSLTALLLVVSLSAIGVVFFVSKRWESERKFVICVLISELVFIAVTGLVSCCAISGVWP